MRIATESIALAEFLNWRTFMSFRVAMLSVLLCSSTWLMAQRSAPPPRPSTPPPQTATPTATPQTTTAQPGTTTQSGTAMQPGTTQPGTTQPGTTNTPANIDRKSVV